MSLNKLTPAQRAIWAAAKLDTENFRFNASFFLDLGHDICWNSIDSALSRLSEEAELQRVSVQETEDDVVQSPHFPARALIFHHRFAELEQARQWMAQQTRRPFALDGSAPLLQWHLIALGTGQTLLYCKYHHLVLDGYGQSLLLARLAEIYNAARHNTPTPPSPWVSNDAWFNNNDDYAAGPHSQRDRAFWTAHLANAEGPTTLGTRKSTFARDLLQIRHTLDDDLYQQITTFSSARAASLPQLLLTLFAAYCHRLTQQQHIHLGLAVTGRANQIALQKPAMHANEVPLRLSFDGIDSFEQLAQHARQQLALAIKHQQYRNEDIHRALGLGAPEDKLTHTLLNIISFEHPLAFGDRLAECHQFTTGPIADLTLTIFIRPRGIELLWDANPDNHCAELLERHAGRLMQFMRWCLAHQAIDCPAQTLLLPEDRQALQSFNQTSRPYDLQLTLPQYIDRQAQQTPNAIALQFGDETLSYRALIRRSETWARNLLARGVRPGDAVGLYGERSLAMTVALLAIQKAGAAYVPLDPELPTARLQTQLKQSDIRTLIYLDMPPALDPAIQEIHVGALSDERPDISLPAPSPEAAAYIIFTSGSTGQPKGVVVSHRAIANRILWMQEAYALTPRDRVLQKTPFTFDVSVWEFFWPLVTGATLVVAPPGSHKDPRQLITLLQTAQISTLHFVPPMLDLFLAELNGQPLPTLRLLFCSGEALKIASVERMHQHLPHCALHNLYGPTEAAVDVSYWHCAASSAPAGSVPIGYPVANTQLWVLDAQQRPLPPGSVGELYIGGVQLADGYINQPELSAQRFLPLPESLKSLAAQGKKLYRTGDLVCLTEQRGLEFLGRIDHQVKIRGLRIELGEIEAQLVTLPQVKHAVVSTHRSGTDAERLIGYLVLENTAHDPATTQHIARQLGNVLPEYMVPALWVILPTLPYLTNGKVNRKALPAPEQQPAVETAALTEEEQRVAAVWRQVLQRDDIAPDAAFYSLGGDSMMAIRVRSALEKAGYAVELTALYRNPSLRQLAKQLTPFQPQQRVAIAPFSLLSEHDRQSMPAELEDAYPLSAMQKSMAWQAEVERDTSVYRVVTSLTVELALEPTLLQKAIEETCRRHPLLRSSFDLSNYSQPVQLVHPQAPVSIAAETSLNHLTPAQQQAFIQNWVEQAKFRHLPLNNAPCLTFHTHALHSQRFQLSVVEHHVVLDGWSDLLMLDEIVENYRELRAGRQPRREPLQSHYRDFIAAELQIMQDPQAAAYWQTQLAELNPAPLPRRESVSTTRHKCVRAQLPPALTPALHALAAAHQLPLKALLTAAHLKVQAVLTGQTAVATGLVFNGRPAAQDADKMIGVFLNTLPLALALETESFVALAKRIARFEADSWRWGRYPLTAIQRDYGQEIVLDSYINYMDFHRSWGDENSVISQAFGVADTNFTLAVNYLMDPVSQRLSLWFDCNIGQLSETLCELLPDYYLRALQQMVAMPLQEVLAAPLMPPAQEMLLQQWNQTAVDYQADDCAYRQFERQAQQHPDREALCCRHDSVSFDELNRLANAMAARLQDAGVKPGDLVGVCLRRSVELVASLIAIHKTGAAWLPLDPDYPVERLDYIVKDACLTCLVTQSETPELPVAVRIEWPPYRELLQQPHQDPRPLAQRDAPAYVIYTSGSTGKPKGTVILQKNLTNFLMGMDDAVGCRPDDSLLALTSISFDISVLEIFWPLTRGANVVLAPENLINNLAQQESARDRSLDFSLFFFGAATNNERRQEGYQLVMDAARYADANGFKAVWTPERHFHAFGGLYPNPSVMSAALASVTQRVELRCGSVVAPLHDSLRLAEEWALVDNLSAGRVGLAFASGWNTNDFALAPDSYPQRKTVMLKKLKELRSLWQGGSLRRVNGSGQEIELTVYPSPVQRDLPIWFTSSGDIATFELAGTYGVNLLTHLLGQDIVQLEQKIAAYRQAWRSAGHPGDGHVTLMIHTFLLPDEQLAKSVAKGPFRDYLRTSTGLLRELSASMGLTFQQDLPADDLESLLDMAVERYFERSGLFGSPESVLPLLGQLHQSGVDEIAGLIDFGIDNDRVMEGLQALKQLQKLHRNEQRDAPFSFAGLLQRHPITMVQSTPSFMAAVMAEPAAIEAMASLRSVLIGGEAFPVGLAQQLSRRLSATVYNMYGPTETTIWSSVHPLPAGSATSARRIPIGKPIANTQMLILGPGGHPSPIGVPGELWIGGDGVCQGYLGKAALTAERFVVQPAFGRPFYRTGDRALWNADGEIEFVGRIDRQVKILGHRIELDEIESALSRHPLVKNVAVVAARLENDRHELVAYIETHADRRQTDSSADNLIAHWGQLWNNAYQDRANYEVSQEQDRQFAGWLSSYTGEPIPPVEMHEWLTHTLTKIRACERVHLIDVGVGMGQIMRHLAPNSQSYHGLDLSAEALVVARQSLPPALQNAAHIQLTQGDAMQLAAIAAKPEALVILNSVIQYFPDLGYLKHVLQEALRITHEGGVIYLGDVRSLDELAAFHTSVQFFKASPLARVAEIRQQIARDMAAEKELCLSFRYFHTFNTLFGTARQLRLELKRGKRANELNDFRYDVIIGRQETGAPCEALDWPGAAFDTQALAALSGQLRDIDPQRRVIIRNLPNYRLQSSLDLMTLLAAAHEEQTRWDIEKQLWEVSDPGRLYPEDIAGHFEALGYQVQLTLSQEDGLRYFNLELTQRQPLSSGHRHAGTAEVSQ
ncbi:MULTISPECIES: non-ribosomal peptide synthetase [Serratia]|uniref:non-ribosomal peptide synthetase n=1 Tax=Serratia TaxID=613 RepID=UPI0015726479|nr:non-ribosomal peptide synthetase [Serratia marcescens]MBI6135787.1 amino acid adenylation domain-containing protein [Serratia marcescens]MDN0030243.1 non-ribosomal peptide synthetase [Serratia marcescens]NSM19604.1 amino acid adenylation domain-containing protein [Serratia marcescens]NSM46721.1 amino acid adenylation domain-containing protein [Serratia marcescens]